MPVVPTHVHNTVDDHLDAIETSHDVTAVLAVARGSHAWGAASHDSDYDVGFVFVPDDLRRYAHLDQLPTVLTADHGEFEYQGWDVRKFASLLADSNDGAIDLCRSPIRYRTQWEPTELTAYIERTYNPIDCYHAWRGIATNNYRKYLSGERQSRQTVKRNLIVARAAMGARYLKTTGERGGHELPAIDFERFLTEQAPQVFEAERIACTRRLLERKRRGEGTVMIGDVVGKAFATPPTTIDPDVHARSGPDTDRLDSFVDEMIASVSDSL